MNQTTNLVQPILNSILACLLWGLIFVAPFYLESFCCIDIVLGRYLSYGVVSVILLSFYICLKQEKSILKHWKEASYCALVMNLGYFTALMLGMRFSDPAMIALIVGIAPITITAVSCLKKQEKHPLSVLLWPACSIFLGLCLVNLQLMQSQESTFTFWQYLQGIFYGFIALAAWTWYVIYNTKFLRTNPTVSPHQWTILIGVMTLGMTLLGIGIRWWMLEEEYLQLFSFTNGEGIFFVGIVFALGVLCSSIAFSLWNAASSRLPAALSGQIAILETLFSLIFVYSIHQQWPSLLEILGMTCILVGVWRGLYLFLKKEPSEST